MECVFEIAVLSSASDAILSANYIGRVRHADRSYDTATIVTYERIASIALKYTLQRHVSSATIAHNFQGKI